MRYYIVLIMLLFSAALVACGSTSTPTPQAAAPTATPASAAPSAPTATSASVAPTATQASVAPTATQANPSPQPSPSTAASPSQSGDQAQVEQAIRGYFTALQAKDNQRVRQYLHDPEHVSDATLAALYAQQAQYQLVSVGTAQIQGDHATATIQVRDANGTTFSATLAMEREHNQWAIDNASAIQFQATPGTPATTGQVRDQIEQVIRDYYAALQAQDRDRVRQYMHDPEHVATQTLDRIQAEQRDHQYQFVALTDVQVQGDHATATFQLRDRDGAIVTRTLSLEFDHGQWSISNP